MFIADNIKEVIPEFLLLLKGVIDCPDLPLNVSRSALQNDGFVQKISEYISKKVADKLTGMCKTDRESYEKYWDDISPFIKFGCIKDRQIHIIQHGLISEKFRYVLHTDDAIGLLHKRLLLYPNELNKSQKKAEIKSKQFLGLSKSGCKVT